MSLTGIPPLDLQTEHLDRSQYPSLRALLLIASVICALLIVTWASHKDGFAGRNDVAAVAPVKSGPVDRDLISRAIPLRP